MSPIPASTSRRDLALAMASLVAAFLMGSLITWAVLRPAPVLVPDVVSGLVIEPRPLDDFLRLSQQMIRERRYQDAVTLCERALLLYPGQVGLSNNLATAQLLLGEVGKAEAMFAAIAKAHPGYALAGNNLDWARRERVALEGQLLADQAAARKAELAGDRAGEAAALLAVVGIYDRLGEPEKSLAICERILGFDPRNAEALNRAGLALMAMDQPSRAIERFEAAIALSPDAATYRRNLRDAEEAQARKR